MYSVISVPVFALLYLFTASMVVLLIFLSFLNLKIIVRCGIYFWANTIFLLMGKRLRIAGLENFDKNRQYVLVANHASLFDIMAIMAFHPGVSWFGHVRLTKIPVFKNLLKQINYIPVKRGSISNTKTIVDKMLEKSKGLTIAIFPEGTRTIDGQLNDFYRGFIHILRNTQIELLPVTLNGFYHLKPKNRFFINFGTKINVVIHKPINYKSLVEKNDQEIISTVKGVIESAYSIV